MGLLKGYILVIFFGSLLCYFPHTVLGYAINVDGFNLYKDFLRGKNDEFNEIGEEDGGGLAKVTSAGYSELGSDSLGKRSNKFKNFMLNREGLEASDETPNINKFYFTRVLPKRGALLSWAIPAANRVRIGSYRPPGINRPAAAE
ncbi:uncharacterized protein LOC129785911 isoform X2 [Lutzomyia longipalpis]|uniref:uncharacterized protein LOC129785911 isoform X2 n=1 Tax=Lutzomyia longipalpis TaxID=7200 RepID=UPI00248357AA|nr:uncharacterized protein LOC129785911 isoform X2 [Lutzomyia longipalpis]